MRNNEKEGGEEKAIVSKNMIEIIRKTSTIFQFHMYVCLKMFLSKFYPVQLHTPHAMLQLTSDPNFPSEMTSEGCDVGLVTDTRRSPLW